MKLTGGRLRGCTILTPDRRITRPTLSRVRKTLFDIICRRVEGVRFLDLCAGSGAVGIEALSRGALRVTFVDRDRRALVCIRKNLSTYGLHAQVIGLDVRLALRYLEKKGTDFDIIYLDPPYASSRLQEEVLAFLANSQLLTSKTQIFFETDCVDLKIEGFSIEKRKIGGAGHLFCLKKLCGDN